MAKKKMHRRNFLKTVGMGAASMAMPGLLNTRNVRKSALPNIFLAISDDQSWPHASAYGSEFVRTPAFDRIAEEGVLFTHAYCPAPQCSPCRAALLTGRNIWQLEEAGTHASLFPKKYKVYTELLEETGYHVGYTSKGWGPGNWEASGRTRNPAGYAYNNRTQTPPLEGINRNDYSGNFQDFLRTRPKGAPFCFWFGGKEPHRSYENGSGLRAGKRLDDVSVPGFLPDHEVVRSDLLDYAVEVEWFDRHLGSVINLLEEMGELDTTIIVVASDNGMPFPRAKANLYEYGTHMPLAVRWGEGIPSGRVVDDLVSFIDMAPTFIAAAGLEPPDNMTGRSLMNVLTSGESGRVDENRNRVFTGRERHTHARPDNLGYPSRAIRTGEYLYIWNLKPDRWPAGDPEGFYDIDGSPTKTFLLEHRDTEPVRRLFNLACARRPAEEFYAVEKDPYCLKNLANNPAHAHTKEKLRAELDQVLTDQNDPRVLGYGDIFESYPRFNHMRREFKGFSEQGKYNLKYQKAAEEQLKEFQSKKSRNQGGK